MRISKLSAPEAAPDGNDVEPGVLCRLLDGIRHLLGDTCSIADESVTVPDYHMSTEPRTLPGCGLLLDRHDIAHLLRKLALRKEVVNDLCLLDGERILENVIKGLYLSCLHQAAEFRGRMPLFLLHLTRSALTALWSFWPGSTFSLHATPWTLVLGYKVKSKLERFFNRWSEKWTKFEKCAPLISV
eukprot:XP_001705991.1 Hypothetical protein GL50803_19584 [Giardia lamblia ATCC 50803]